MKIASLAAKKILASMGNETVEATIALDDGRSVSASVPAGISAGKYEVAKVEPDRAVREIGEVGDQIVNNDWTQESLDEFLVSRKMGGNASLAVSAAYFKSQISNLPTSRKFREVNKFQIYTKFPKLMVLMFEGGKHGSGGIVMQEFLKIEESVGAAKESFEKMRRHLQEANVETLVGAEGGFSPGEFDDEKILGTIKSLFPDGKIALDAAGCFQGGSGVNYETLLQKYPIISIEDPYSDEDWDKWIEFYGKYGGEIMVVGDDLTVTNSERIKMAISKKTINAVVIKPNQNGTISGAVQAVGTARDLGMKIVVSHRGEETDDDWIVDFALAVEADYVKFGGMDRGERIAKYNRLVDLGMK
jgi:enolase